MSLYAIGDLHLSFSTDKPMDIFGRRWKNHVAKIEKNWKKKITSKDTIVLTGDHSWGRNLDEAQKDLISIAIRIMHLLEQKDIVMKEKIR